MTGTAEEREAIRREVSAAAQRLVGAFAAHDTDAYFAAFAPEATFLFHTTGRLLDSRADYRAEWAQWEAEGFQVLECTSAERRVDVVGQHVAIFTHRVSTRVRMGHAESRLAERETIVFRRDEEGTWLGVHEHLSPDPESD